MEVYTDVTWTDNHIVAWLKIAYQQIEPKDFVWSDVKKIILKPEKILSIDLY